MTVVVGSMAKGHAGHWRLLPAQLLHPGADTTALVGLLLGGGASLALQSSLWRFLPCRRPAIGGSGHRGMRVLWDPAILLKINSNFVT